MLNKRRFKKPSGEIVKKVKKFAKTKNPTITCEQYDEIRVEYLKHGNIQRTSREIGVCNQTVKKWVNEPHPRYSPELSILQWSTQIALRSTELVIEQQAQMNANLKKVSHDGLQKAINAQDNVVYELEGEKQKDGTIKVNSTEMGKSIRVLKQFRDLHEDAIADIGGKPRRKQEEESVAPVQIPQEIHGDMNIQVNLAPTRFQGARDLGHEFEAPENPATMWEESLHFMKKHAGVFAQEGGDNQHKLETAVKLGHKMRKNDSREE